MEASPVREQLALALKTLRPALRDGWLPEFSGHPLRSDLMGNPRLHDRIVSAICPDIERCTEAPEEEIRTPELLAVVFDIGPAEAAKRLGAAFNSNRIARLVTTNHFAIALPDLTLDELKYSLRFRDIAPADEGVEMSGKGLIADGQLCLAAWLSLQPNGIRARIGCLWDLPALGPEIADLENRSALTEAVLGDMAA